jgi:hypothetical protein
VLADSSLVLAPVSLWLAPPCVRLFAQCQKAMMLLVVSLSYDLVIFCSSLRYVGVVVVGWERRKVKRE